MTVRHLILLTLLLAVLILYLVLPGPVMANADLTVIDDSVLVYFPQGIYFNIGVQGPATITHLRLHYQVDRMNYGVAVSESWPQFTPSNLIKTKWAWDSRKASLPTGAVIRYWWTVRDAAGGSVKTLPKTVTFDDNRFTWRSVDSAKVRLHWYEGDQGFADNLLATSEKALDRISADIGALPQRLVNIYIYGNTTDLQSAMTFPQEWTGGAAFTEYGTILLGIAKSQLEWGIGALAHELTHLVVHQLAFSPYGDQLPTWLDEGLAMYGQGPQTSDTVGWLRVAINQNRLLSVRTLSSSFSAVDEEARISYAESDSLVRFLVGNYGKEKMVGLLNALKVGDSTDSALKQTYGFDSDGLDAVWKNAMSAQLASGIR